MRISLSRPHTHAHTHGHTVPAIRVLARVARELFYRAYFLPGAKAKCIEQTLEQSERERERKVG